MLPPFLMEVGRGAIGLGKSKGEPADPAPA